MPDMSDLFKQIGSHLTVMLCLISQLFYFDNSLVVARPIITNRVAVNSLSYSLVSRFRYDRNLRNKPVLGNNVTLLYDTFQQERWYLE